MRKIWVVLALALVLAGLGGGEAGAAESWAPVYLNGEKSELRALAVNGTSYLPLRDLAEVFALDIDWNQGEKRVDLGCMGKYNLVWVERKSRAVGYMGEDGDIYWDNEWDLGFEPLLRDGKVWLALRFFEDLTEAEVSWNEEKQGIWIEGIPIWQGGRWTVDRPEWREDILWDDQGNGWLALRVGEPTMGHDNLWRLTREGSKERVARDWYIKELKCFGGRCYWLSGYMGFAGGYDIMAVDAAGKLERLGLESMIYNNSIRDDGGLLVTGGEDNLPEKWRVDAEGVWAAGFDREALIDDVVDDEELARETYGWYRLWPGGQEKIQSYELPRKATVEEQVEQGYYAWTPIYLNGEATNHGGIRYRDVDSGVPQLAVREMCELLGCEFSWEQEKDWLVISCPGQRVTIDCAGGRAEWVRLVGGKEVVEQRVVSLSKYGEKRQLAWDFYQGLNGAAIRWDKEGNALYIDLEQ